jgi:predicted methyltransferase
MRHSLSLGLLVLLLSACTDKPEAPAQTPEVSSSQPATSPIAGALQDPNRFSGDAADDEWRKPTEVLSLLEVKPGMRVLDYFAGGGYYSELLSHLVGPTGQVIAYNNEPYQKYAADRPAQRYGSGRLPNVAQLTAPPEELPIEPQSVDAALIVNAYHDLHWRSKDGSWPHTDAKIALEKLAVALKPGASVVVVDHVANAGSDPATSVDTLHRIDPEIIKRDFNAAGFAFETESLALRNPSDDHSVGVFDPSVRHKTDQVIYRFRKS